MSDSNATVNIPKDILEPIVRAQVAAGIAAAIGDPAKIIEGVVEHALAQKVDSDGRISKYSSDNKYNIVEIMAKKAIHETVQEAVEDWISEQRPAILEQVKKSLSRKQTAFAKALVDGMVSAAKQNWNLKCEITMPREY